MPRSYWGRYLAIAGLAVLLPVVASYAQEKETTPDNNTKAEIAQQDTAKENGDSTEHIPPEVVTPDADSNPTQSASRVEDTQANQETQYSIRDLAAQESMAKWTRCAAIIMAVETGAAVIGIILLLVTLKETRTATAAAQRAVRAAEDTVDVTREIGRAETRAYLTVEEVVIDFDKLNSCLISFCKLGNIGNTPAFDIDIVIEVSVFIGGKTVRHYLPSQCDFVSIKGRRTIPSIHAQAKIDREDFVGANGCMVSVGIFAKDVFKEQITTFENFIKMSGPSPNFQFGENEVFATDSHFFNAHRISIFESKRTGSIFDEEPPKPPEEEGQQH